MADRRPPSGTRYPGHRGAPRSRVGAKASVTRHNTADPYSWWQRCNVSALIPVSRARAARGTCSPT